MALNQRLMATKSFRAYLAKRLCKEAIEQIKKLAAQEIKELRYIQRCKNTHE